MSSIKHNLNKAPKTGDWRYEIPIVDKEKCAGCGTCVKFCPEACIDMKHEAHNMEQNKKAEIDYAWCKGCGVCEQVCPTKAITMKKQ
jgi:pyruvate ferredoxin oxidoreductase delta subunit